MFIWTVQNKICDGDQSMKKIKILICIVSAVIILLLALIVLIKQSYENQNNQIENNDTDTNLLFNNTIDPGVEEKDIIQTKQEEYTKISDAPRFYTISDCINKYIDAIQKNESDILYNLSDKDYIKNNSVINDVDVSKNDKIMVYQIHGLYNRKIEQYIAQCFLINQESNNIKTVFFKISLDTYNFTFSAMPISTSSIENVHLQEVTEDIEKNENNSYSYIRYDEKEIVRKYYTFYNNLLLYAPKEAYIYLNEEYKSLKFNNNYDNFVEYINRNRNKIESSVITTYSAENNKYILTNNFKNSYILEENEFMDFDICLDSYTIKPEDFNGYTEEDKAVYYANEVINMINYKEYENLYSQINSTFKENNFDNINKFINYISGNFYDNNYITSTEIEQVDRYYAINMELMDNISSAANRKEVTFIIKVNDNNFEMSFNIS